MKITIAYTIFQVCGDAKMADVVLEELPKVTSQFELINAVYMLPAFKDQRLTALLNEYRHHPDYLVAYNATRAMQMPETLVEKSRNKVVEEKAFGRSYSVKNAATVDRIGNWTFMNLARQSGRCVLVCKPGIVTDEFG